MATIDLSALKAKPQEAREPIEVEAAFLVIIRPGGAVQASPDIDAPIVPSHPVTLDQMESATHRIWSDIQAGKVANIIQMGMRQAISAAEGQRLAQNLGL